MPALNNSIPFLAMENPAVAEKPVTALETEEPWSVVVHNDPVNLMSYVTMVFERVFGFSKAKARKHMMEVHEKGKSIVWTGSREKAEHYVQQLHTFLLHATLQRQPGGK